MNDLPAILDLDQTVEVTVKVGGREFKLTQQSYPTIRKVIQFVNGGGGVAADGENSDWTEIMDQNYLASLPVVALLFGYETENPEKEAVVQFLTGHLTPHKVVQIFQTWWKINEVDDFFDRAGKMLMHPDLVAGIKAEKAKEFGGTA